MRAVFIAFLTLTAALNLLGQGQTVLTPTYFKTSVNATSSLGTVSSNGDASFNMSVSTGVMGAPTAGMLTLYGQGASGGAITFQAPNTISASYNWLLPGTTPRQTRSCSSVCPTLAPAVSLL